MFGERDNDLEGACLDYKKALQIYSSKSLSDTMQSQVKYVKSKIRINCSNIKEELSPSKSIDNQSSEAKL